MPEIRALLEAVLRRPERNARVALDWLSNQRHRMAVATTMVPLPRGRSVLRDARYNRGTAFTAEERAALGLEGLQVGLEELARWRRDNRAE